MNISKFHSNTMISFFSNKKLIIMLLTACLFGGMANAQWFIKPRAGLNYSHMSQPASVFESTTGNKIGFQLGGAVEYQFSNRIKVEADLVYTRKGFKETRGDFFNTYKLTSHFDYVELPLVAKIPLNSQFSIGGGGYAAYLVNAVQKYPSGITTTGATLFKKLPQEGFSKMDMGFVLDFSFVTGNFEVGTRYNHGWKKVTFTMPDDPEYGGPAKLEFGKNRVLQLYVAYRLEQ